MNYDFREIFVILEMTYCEYSFSLFGIFYPIQVASLLNPRYSKYKNKAYFVRKMSQFWFEFDRGSNENLNCGISQRKIRFVYSFLRPSKALRMLDVTTLFPLSSNAFIQIILDVISSF